MRKSAAEEQLLAKVLSCFEGELQLPLTSRSGPKRVVLQVGSPLNATCRLMPAQGGL